MASKKKFILSICACCFILLSVTLGIIAVFAAQQVSLTSSVSVTYVADKVTGTATASYSIDGGTSWNDAGSSTTILADGTTTGELNFSSITLNKDNSTIIYKYTFTNTASNICYASVNLDNITKSNCTLTYSLDNSTYSALNVGVVLNATGLDAQDYYIKVTFTDQTQDGSFTGNFSWNLSVNRDNFYEFNGTQVDSTYYYYGLYPQTYDYNATSKIYDLNQQISGTPEDIIGLTALRDSYRTGWTYSRGYDTSFIKSDYYEYVIDGELYVYDDSNAYKVEPIQWFKDGNEYTSKYSLGNSIWDDDSAEWYDSLIQSWLNDNFYTEAGLDKLTTIADTTLDTSSTGFTNSSTDKIYVCSQSSKWHSSTNFSQLDTSSSVYFQFWVMKKSSDTMVYTQYNDSPDYLISTNFDESYLVIPSFTMKS